MMMILETTTINNNNKINNELIELIKNTKYIKKIFNLI